VNSRGEGITFGNSGAALIDHGRLEDAESYLLQSLDLTQKSGDWRREAIDYWDLGVVYYSRGEIPKATEYMQYWVDYEIEIEHPDAERHTSIVEMLKEIPAIF